MHRALRFNQWNLTAKLHPFHAERIEPRKQTLSLEAMISTAVILTNASRSRRSRHPPFTCAQESLEQAYLLLGPSKADATRISISYDIVLEKIQHVSPHFAVRTEIATRVVKLSRSVPGVVLKSLDSILGAADVARRTGQMDIEGGGPCGMSW